MVIKLVIEVVGRIFARRPTAVCSRPSATVTAATRTANPTGKFSPIPPCGVATVLRSSTAFYPAHFSGLRCPRRPPPRADRRHPPQILPSISACSRLGAPASSDSPNTPTYGGAGGAPISRPGEQPLRRCASVSRKNQPQEGV